MGKYENFTWYEFGVVEDPREDGTYLYVRNTEGDERKISVSAYKDSVPILRDKIKMLKGKHCVLRVSQNTKDKDGNDWSKEKWFSDIRLYKGEADKAGFPESGDDKQTQPVAELKIDIGEFAKNIGENINETLVEQRDKNAEGRKRESEAHENTKEKLIKAESANAELRVKSQSAEGKTKIGNGNEADDEETKKRARWLKNLKKKNIKVGQKWDIIVRKNSHAEKTFALCAGAKMFDNQTKLNVEIKSHIKENVYEIAVISEIEVMRESKTTRVALGAENQGRPFATTFFHPQQREFTNVSEEMGYTRESLKDRNGIDLVKIHDEVVAQMNVMRD